VDLLNRLWLFFIFSSLTPLLQQRDVAVQPVLDFLTKAGAPGSLDEMVHAKLPWLTAGLLILTAHVITTVAPPSVPPDQRLELLLRRDPARPTPWELERAERGLDLTL
jgi:hypothetical protein